MNALILKKCADFKLTSDSLISFHAIVLFNDFYFKKIEVVFKFIVKKNELMVPPHGFEPRTY